MCIELAKFLCILQIKKTKRYESLLEQQHGAQGRGLHEKLDRVQQRLPAELIKRLRFIATVRNKLIHEDGFSKVIDLAKFRDACTWVDGRLNKGRHSLIGRLTAKLLGLKR